MIVSDEISQEAINSYYKQAFFSTIIENLELEKIQIQSQIDLCKKELESIRNERE